MKTYFLNLLAALVVCSWTAECSFNDDGESKGDITVNSRSDKDSSGSESISDSSLYEAALQISAANQARWEEYSAKLTDAERSVEYPGFTARNPVDVNLIYEQLKKEARSKEKDLI
jgi:carboxylesterase type B